MGTKARVTPSFHKSTILLTGKIYPKTYKQTSVTSVNLARFYWGLSQNLILTLTLSRAELFILMSFQWHLLCWALSLCKVYILWQDAMRKQMWNIPLCKLNTPSVCTKYSYMATGWVFAVTLHHSQSARSASHMMTVPPRGAFACSWWMRPHGLQHVYYQAVL